MNYLCSRMFLYTLYGNPYSVFVITVLYILHILFVFCMFIASPHHTVVLAAFHVCVCAHVCPCVCVCIHVCVCNLIHLRIVQYYTQDLTDFDEA